MKKRQFFAVFAAFAMGLSGCGGGSGAPGTEAETSVQAEKETSPQPEPESGETGGAARVTDGGSPWLDTNLKNNITEGMETSPKDDFHLYVNYEWLLNNEIPDGYSTSDAFLDVEQATTEKTRALLEDDSLESHEAKLVQDFYHAWLDWDGRNAAGMEPLTSRLEDVESIETLQELSEFVCDRERSYYVPTFVSMGNSVDLGDATRYITEIGGDGFILGDAAEYENRTDMGNRYCGAYRHVAVTLLERSGYGQEEAEEMFENAISLETRLAEVSITSAEAMSPDIYEKIYNVYQPEELSSLSPAFPLAGAVEGMGYGEAEEFLISQPEYFTRLNELYTEENLEALKDYMQVKCAISFCPYLDREAWDLHIETQNAINGTVGRLEDGDYAFRAVMQALTEPLSQAYLEKYDASAEKEDITRICREVIGTYREMLQGEDWMTEATREKAIEKLDSIQIHAVYPDYWYDYSDLSLDGLSYWDCVEAVKDFQTRRDRGRTDQEVNPQEWGVNILETNAYYNPQDNSVNILLGILGNEFYRDDMTEEEMLGGIGVVIGHEISHAFDTSGAQFDKDGNLANWWTEEDLAAFAERADRLIAYYDTIIPFEGYTVPGRNVQGEAIADMGGVKCMLAIAAEDPDFDYDSFFRQFATIWRRLSAYEYEVDCLTQDPHPLHFLRTNATLQQFEEFYETYDIQPGDGMYLAPEERVAVW